MLRETTMPSTSATLPKAARPSVNWPVRASRSMARLALRAPVAERIWFAGEATSVELWGTVGGAWLEGRRAATEIQRFLGGFRRLPTVADLVGGAERSVARARPRSLT